jgi:hypothetical protein
MTNSKHPQGIIIVLTILIIAVVIASAVIFSTILIRDVAQSRLIDQSMQAHYLAESGVEHALYQIRKREAVVPDKCAELQTGSSCDQTTGFCTNFSNEVSCVTAANQLNDAVGNWEIAVSHEQTFQFELQVGQTIQIDLFDPLIQVTPLGSLVSNIGRITVERYNSNFTRDLHYTLLKLSPGQPVQEIDKGALPLGNCVPQPPTQLCPVDIPSPNISPNDSFALRLRPFYFLDDAPGLLQISIFRPAAQGGEQLPIPSRLIVGSEAGFGNSVQRVTVQTPTRPPVSGLFDFVVFSEEEIVKIQ